VGQYSDLSYLDARFDELSVDRKTLACDIPGLFVVGGRKTGASYIIEAVALGHRVASSIHNYLQDEPALAAESPAPPVVKYTRQEMQDRVFKGEIQLAPKIEPVLLPMDERVTSFREVVLGMTDQQARREASRCLQCGICAECLACVYACDVNAIDHEMVAYEKKFQVGAVILAPGYQAYNAQLSEEFGFGQYPNVVTALQFERLLSASGPTHGHVRRPSDSATPQRIAFLQCIGSRDQDHDYCSAVCCMYATKEAIIAKEHHPQLDIHVFMMDMRAYSKGYLGYYRRAQEHYGIQYERCRISALQEDPVTHELILHHVNESGKRQVDRFDMVVLSVGMEISQSVRDLGRRLGVELDEYGFCHSVRFNPIETSRQGIYAVGPFREPKDIPESVVEASGAAAAASARLADSRFTLTIRREYPDEKDVSAEPARIGVFVCHCGSNIAGFLDVPDVAAYARELPGVVHAEDLLYACSQDAIDQITKSVVEHEINRVVVASCSPLTHQPLFQDSIRSAGLNPYLFEMANIRNQCSWVHSFDRDAATTKAGDLVRMAVARAATLEAQQTFDVPVDGAALVVGGGAAGMTAAINLAEQGFPVYLIEREDELGGNLRYVLTPYPATNGDESQHPQKVLHTLVEKVTHNTNITVHLDSKVIVTRGFMGNFTSIIQSLSGERNEISHGATILATGGQEYRGPEYGYGTDPRIVTQQELEELLVNQPSEIKNLKSLVIIQCVGPAEEFCSRICCTVSLKNALALKEQVPGAQITILHRDIRSYGFKERLYTRARELGVLFMRYDDRHRPQVSVRSGVLTIEAWDPVLQKGVTFEPERLVLSMPVEPDPDTRQVSKLFKVPVDADGFFLEAHVKLRPVDFATDGVFMAGTAHYPKLLDETIVQAQAAASRAARILSRDTLTAGGRVAVVDPALCTGCLTCVRVCPFNIPLVQSDLTGVGGISGAAYIEAAICQGCGSCVAECPARAIQLMHYTDTQMGSMVRALTRPDAAIIPLEAVLDP
jgi:heterodisulfide reductase subunit A-like polyferredoxin